MSDVAVLLRGYGPLLLFLGTICVLFGLIVAVLERNRHSTGSPTATWRVAVVAALLSLVGAVLLLRIEPLGLWWGAAMLAIAVAVVAVVGTAIIGVLALTPVGTA